MAGTIGDQQAVSGYLGTKLVNTFLDHDQSTGTITSPTFTIDSDYIDLLVGGGNHPYTANPAPGSEPTAVNLVVDGNVVATATGQDNETLNWVAWNTASLQGQQAQIQIVDNNTGGWGHILVDHIVFSPEAAIPVSTETAVNLLVDGEVVRTATGPNSETLDWANWDVRDLAGETATHPDHRQQHRRLGPHPGRPVHLRRRTLPCPRPSGPTGSTTAATSTPASPSTTCPSGKRIMIAWMNNWQYGSSIPTDPWRSAMSVPRELNLERIAGETELTVQTSATARVPA